MGTSGSTLAPFTGDRDQRYAITTAKRDVPEYPLPEPLMLEQFELHDKNGNGTIDCEEMLSIVRQSFESVDRRFLNAVKIMFTVCDINNNGALSFNEFRHLLYVVTHFTDVNDCVLLAADIDHDFVVTYGDFLPVQKRYRRIVGRLR